MSRTPTTGQVDGFSVDDAVDPVRAFVGPASAEPHEQRADLVVQELERMGGFNRDVLLLVTPTGTGWVNEQIAQPIEYFHGGRTATVASSGGLIALALYPIGVYGSGIQTRGSP